MGCRSPEPILHTQVRFFTVPYSNTSYIYAWCMQSRSAQDSLCRATRTRGERARAYADATSDIYLSLCVLDCSFHFSVVAVPSCVLYARICASTCLHLSFLMTFDLTRLTLSQLVALVRTLDLFVHHQSCPTIIQTGHVHSAVEIQANHCPLCVLRALPARALVTSVTGEEAEEGVCCIISQHISTYISDLHLALRPVAVYVVSLLSTMTATTTVTKPRTTLLVARELMSLAILTLSLSPSVLSPSQRDKCPESGEGTDSSGRGLMCDLLAHALGNGTLEHLFITGTEVRRTGEGEG
jgi:hypothetical protein